MPETLRLELPSFEIVTSPSGGDCPTTTLPKFRFPPSRMMRVGAGVGGGVGVVGESSPHADETGPLRKVSRWLAS